MKSLLPALTAAMLFPAGVAPAAAANADGTQDLLQPAISAALQADGIAASKLLAAIDGARLSTEDRRVQACMRERLGTAPVAASTALGDAFLAEVLVAYQAYWRSSFRREAAASDNEAGLLAALNRSLAAERVAPVDNLDELETVLAQRIEAHGWHSLHGVTAPLREFMLWKTQTPTHYDIALPAGRQAVTVVFLDDFASLGWAAYATCDRAHTGGWTGSDRLYAVRAAYDLDSENFRVSYLAHEAQHFADNAAHPGLEQPELEYRAKLTELALADTTQRELLDGFAGNISDDRAIPHSFANGRVVADLRRQLGLAAQTRLEDIAPARIRSAALRLLDDAERGGRAR
jgi:hypothetical protein